MSFPGDHCARLALGLASGTTLGFIPARSSSYWCCKSSRCVKLLLATVGTRRSGSQSSSAEVALEKKCRSCIRPVHGKKLKIGKAAENTVATSIYIQAPQVLPQWLPIPLPGRRHSNTSFPEHLQALLSFWHKAPGLPRFEHMTSHSGVRAEGTTSLCRSLTPSVGRSQGGFVTAKELQSIQNLKTWLHDRMPLGGSAVERWGKERGTKCLGNLWTELLEGESCLSDSFPPRRSVNVVSVRIKHPATGRMLVEAQQLMQDGSLRTRNRPLSEKMKPGENVEEAALRGVREELGLDLGDSSKVFLLKDSIQSEVEDKVSLSYPGLPSRYTVHTIVATVEGLPEGPFSTVEGEGGVDLPLEPPDSWGPCSCPDLAHCSCDEESRRQQLLTRLQGVKVHFWDWVDQLPCQK